MNAPVTEVTVLGPFAVRRGDATVDVGGPRPRALLAALLARPGVVVSRDELVGELWQERPPRTAIETLHSYVSRLRRALGAPAGGPAISTQGRGYTVEVGATHLDAWSFAADVATGGRQLRTGASAQALRTLGDALARWRGEPYAGLDHGPIVESEAARLLELRATALEDRIDASLAGQEVSALLAELEGIVRTHPLRERLHAQRMLALYRAGRQGAALEAFREARALLVDELGVEPGPLLQRVQAMVLAQEGDLDHATTIDLEGRGPALRVVAAPAADPADGPPTGAEAAATDRPAGEAAPVSDDLQVATLHRLVGVHRLVTVTAPSGAGKTHLLHRAVPALESVARPVVVVEVDDDPHGSATAAVAAVRGTAAQPAAVARSFEVGGVLCLDLGDGDVEDAATLVATVLASAPRVRVVVAARERLRLPEEYRWRLSLLGVPPVEADLTTVRDAPAVRFLVDCVRRWHPYFEVDDHNHRLVARVVRAVEGLPLGLALAAEQLETLPLESLVEAVERDPGRLRTRMRAGAARHRSLASAITTLTAPLTTAQRQLLVQLRVFAGGFTSDAVAAVCGDAHDDRLGAFAALLDGSSLTPLPSPTGTTRYRTLPFVADPTLADTPPAVSSGLARRHTDHYVDLAVRAAPHLTGPEQVHWLNRLHEEHDNLRAVLERTLTGGDLAAAATVSGSLTWFWLLFGHADEGVAWVRRIDAAGDEAVAHLDPTSRSRYRVGAARLLAGAGDRPRAQQLLRAAVHDALVEGPPDQLAVALASLAAALLRRRNPTDAARALDDAAAVAGDQAPWVAASIADVRSQLVRHHGDVEASRALLGTAERNYREAGDEWSACLSRLRAARLAAIGGDTDDAARLHRTNLARAIELTASTFDFVGLPRDLHGLAVLARRSGFGTVAARLHDVAADLPREVASVPVPHADVPVEDAAPTPARRARIVEALEASAVLTS